MERHASSRKWSSSSRIVLPFAISSSRTMTSRPVTSPITALMLHPVVGEALLRARATGTPSSRAKAAASLALPRSGRDDGGVGQVVTTEMARQLTERVQVVDRAR